MTQQKSKTKKTPRPAISGTAIDTGFRMKHEPSGTEFALIICAKRFLNGWLEETDGGRLPDTVECQKHNDENEPDPKPVIHRIVDLATGIHWFFEGKDQSTIGVDTTDVIANLLSPPSYEKRARVAGARS